MQDEASENETFRISADHARLRLEPEHPPGPQQGDSGSTQPRTRGATDIILLFGDNPSLGKGV